MSDGSTYDSDDHEIDWIQKRKISILGKVYDIRPNLKALENSSIPRPQEMRPQEIPSAREVYSPPAVFDYSPPPSSVFVMPNHTPLDIIQRTTAAHGTSQNASSSKNSHNPANYPVSQPTQ
jgi:hypothetical protein